MKNKFKDLNLFTNSIIKLGDYANWLFSGDISERGIFPPNCQLSNAFKQTVKIILRNKSENEIDDIMVFCALNTILLELGFDENNLKRVTKNQHLFEINESSEYSAQNQTIPDFLVKELPHKTIILTVELKATDDSKSYEFYFKNIVSQVSLFYTLLVFNLFCLGNLCRSVQQSN